MSLESEVFFLQESWHIGYDSIMNMPSSRRNRMVRRKNDLESYLAAKHKAELARIKSKKF